MNENDESRECCTDLVLAFLFYHIKSVVVSMLQNVKSFKEREYLSTPLYPGGGNTMIPGERLIFEPIAASHMRALTNP